jgi:hypothetical protein
MWQYRHPDYKNKAMKKYRRLYDYYSLGVVLFEIGTWCPLWKFEQRQNLGSLSAEMFSEKLVEKAYTLLGGTIGVIYRDAVLACLKSAFGDATDNEEGKKR